MFSILYSLFSRLYVISVRLISSLNPKAKLWVRGRKGLLQEIANEMKEEARPRIWIHCASLGEFEQGRPVIEKLREKYPDFALVLTFFSPSGYEVRKNYSGVDYVYYLPADTSANASKFISTVNPAFVIWVKYEYWFKYLQTLHAKKIPVLLISAIFRKDQPFFKWFGKPWRNLLKTFSAIFVQNEESKILLKSIGIENTIVVAGDTRYDRVFDLASNAKPIPAIENLITDKPCVVAGSTWPEDELQWIHFSEKKEALLIVAPHEVSPQHIADLEVRFPDAVLFSALPAAGTSTISVVIIDNIGMLSSLYRYASIAYIGGGYNSSGIHNTLEAAAYGKPVIFGPNYEKFDEAVQLIAKGGGFSVSTPLELEAIVTTLLSDKSAYESAAEASRTLVRKNRGATNIILQYLDENSIGIQN